MHVCVFVCCDVYNHIHVLHGRSGRSPSIAPSRLWLATPGCFSGGPSDVALRCAAVHVRKEMGFIWDKNNISWAVFKTPVG